MISRRSEIASILFFLTFWVIWPVAAQQKSFVVEGRRIVLDVDTNTLVLKALGSAAAWEIASDSVESQADIANVPPDWRLAITSSIYRETRTGLQLVVAPKLPELGVEDIKEIPQHSRVIRAVRAAYRYGKTRVVPNDGIVVSITNAVQETIARIESQFPLRHLKAREDIHRFRITASDADVFDISESLHGKANIGFVEPEFLVEDTQLAARPNDLFYTNQWGLSLPDGLDMPATWEAALNRTPVKVAVLDNGFDLGHEDLRENFLPGWDFYANDDDPRPAFMDAHGTACAGLLAAVANNAKGICGIAPWCRIVPVRIAERLSYSTAALSDGLYFARTNGVKVVNISWGGRFATADLIREFAKAISAGLVIVAAAGNDGGAPVDPASFPGVIAVGAINRSEQIWRYSNRGAGLAIVAPSGEINLHGDIWTTDLSGAEGYNRGGRVSEEPSGNYTAHFGGTSAAAPLVAGVAALLFSEFPSLTGAEVRETLIKSARKIEPLAGQWTNGWSHLYGYGKLNAQAALKLGKEMAGLSSGSPATPAGDTLSAGSIDSLTLEANGRNLRLIPDTELMSIVSKDSSATMSNLFSTLTSQGVGRELSTGLGRITNFPATLILVPTQTLTGRVDVADPNVNKAILPVFRHDSTVVIPTGTIAVRLKDGTTTNQLFSIIGTNAISAVSQREDLVRIEPAGTFTEMLQMIQRIKGSGVANSVEPDFVWINKSQ
jgi:hypothetical protein